MYPVRERYRGVSPYLRSVSEFAQSVERRIPTLTRSLDRYLDLHFEDIVEEWQLLTDFELRDLEKRVDKVTADIDRLYQKKSDIGQRAASLEAGIKEIEEGLKEGSDETR